MQITLRTRSESETESVARTIATLIPDGIVIGLTGALGSGKTCFVRGLAAGLGIDPREVSSPTFVYLVEYAGGRLPLRHADLYRLGDLMPDTAEDAFAGIGLYDALEGDGVTVVEWWDYYVGPLPDRLLVVEFVIETVDLRALTLTFSGADLERMARAFSAEERG